MHTAYLVQLLYASETLIEMYQERKEYDLPANDLLVIAQQLRQSMLRCDIDETSEFFQRKFNDHIDKMWEILKLENYN